MKNNFESLLVRSLTHYFSTNHISAFTERRPQTKYRKQFVDIVIDSPSVGYLAIECKSTSTKYLYFSTQFHTEQGLNHTHQVDTINWYLNKTGRVGYLAVEFRVPKGNKFYLIPWTDVATRFNSDSKGYKLEELRGFPRAVKDKRTKLYDVSGLFHADSS